MELPRRNVRPVVTADVAPVDLDPGLPQRKLHAQRISAQNAEQQQINEQTEAQMRRAAQSLMGGVGATVVDNLPHSTGKDAHVPSDEGKALPTRIKRVEQAPQAIVLPTRNVRNAPGDASADLPTFTPARTVTAEVPDFASAQVLPTRSPRVVDADLPASTVNESDPFLPTRPRRAFQPGTVEFQEQLLRDGETMPPEKMGRKQAALYGFLRALASGNLLTGGVGAAVA